MSKSNRTEIAAIAANVQGVNADNFIKFCGTLEDWVNSGEKIPAEKPIDWDVPQLVRDKHNGCVVRTNGIHSDGAFNGVVIVAGDDGFDPVGQNNSWAKGCFVYHGEIPADPAPKTAGLAFLEAISMLGPEDCTKRPSHKRRLFVNYGMLVYAEPYMSKPLSISMEDLTATDWQIVPL